LLIATLVWGFMITYCLRLLQKDIERARGNIKLTSFENLYVGASYNFSAIFASFLGVVVSKKIEKVRLLHYWFLISIVFSLSPFFMENTIQHLLVISSIYGVAFGFGMPTLLAFFADSTEYGDRGFNAGLTFFVSNLLAVPFVVFFAIIPSMLSTFNMLLIMLGWRTIGWITLFCFKPHENFDEKTESSAAVTFKNILENRMFLLYFIPWLIFCLVERFEQPILGNFFNDPFIIELGVIFGPFSALIGGYLADRIGRKKVIVYGFVSMGVAYAFVSFAHQLPFSLWFYVIADGIAWGVFPVIFILVLWGDLSFHRKSREKYYFVGAVPWFIADFMRRAAGPFLAVIPAEASFSLAAFFLFLAVIPLIYAPETMPTEEIEKRKMEEYIEKAKTYREKYAGKAE